MATTTTVLTGATSGIGEATAFALAAKGHVLYLLVRNEDKGNTLKKKLIDETGNKNIFIIKCDLTDLASVVTAADVLTAKLFNIHILINNAGAMFPKFELSKDGLEKTFALNHLGHFLLTMRLMPLLQKGHARIINVSSNAHRAGKPNFDDLQQPQGYSAIKAYGTAKLFNIYFTKSLAQRYADKGIKAYALHPGFVATNFTKKLSLGMRILTLLARPFIINPAKGAETLVYLATAPKLELKSGLYFYKKKVVKPAPVANNEAARNQLWDVSMQLVDTFNI